MVNTASAFHDSASLLARGVFGSGPQVTCSNALPMLVPYKRLIAWETEDAGDEDKSGVADPALEGTNAVRNELNGTKTETDLFARKCHLAVVNGVFCHHV